MWRESFAEDARIASAPMRTATSRELSVSSAWASDSASGVVWSLRRSFGLKSRSPRETFSR